MSKLIEKIEEALTKVGLLNAADEPAPEGTEDAPELGSVIEGEIVPATRKFKYSAIGAPAMEVMEDGSEVVLEDGEYMVKGDSKMIITDGNVSEFVKVEPAVEEEVVEEEVEMKEETPEVKTETKTEEVAEEKVELAEETVAEETETKTEETVVEEIKFSEEIEANFEETLKMASETIRSIMSNVQAGITKPGDYYIYLSVDGDLKVSYANMSSSTYEDLMMSSNEEAEKKVDELNAAFDESLKLQKEKYEAIVESHKSGAVRKTDAPEKTEEVAFSKVDFIKNQIQENKNK